MIRLHDTMAREKRAFEPADRKRVTMYVCGPTVYNRAHIGNARPAVVFDVLARLLRHVYGADSLVYARNVTDVDDKIIEAARAEGVEPAVITERFERHYLEDMGALGVAPPTIAPHATDNIGVMVALIGRLIETGNAYEEAGHVLFNVPSDPEYGALGRRDRDAMIAGARVEVASYKKDPADFVLWKPSPPDMIGWDSPWGRGRPGWHIECSAMIERHLGRTIDIHGGGLDLIFPHHENEIAQSRCAHQAPLARYWVHNGFLSMAGGEKMSKSLGNVVTVGELLEEGHKGETIRLALLMAHYRQPLEWSDTLLAQAKATLDRWYGLALVSPMWPNKAGPSPEVVEALADDLNTSEAIKHIAQLANQGFHFHSARHELVDNEELHSGQQAAHLHQVVSTMVSSGRLLGLLQERPEWWFGQGLGDDARIEHAIHNRAAAKGRRDYVTADRIRDELAAEGIMLLDGPEGTTWRRS